MKKLMIILIVSFLSCHTGTQTKDKQISMDNKIFYGKWYSYPSINPITDEFVDYKEDGTFIVKNFIKGYLKSGSFYTIQGEPKKEIIKLRYQIDSIDNLGGRYLRIIDNDNITIARRYALVDYPFLIRYSMKPKPHDENYFYAPGVFGRTVDFDSTKVPKHHGYNFIFPDTLKEGEIYIYFKKRNGTSKIKEVDRNLTINKLGITDVDEYFDPRYRAFKLYKAFIKRNDKMSEIPVIYTTNELASLKFQEKKSYINKIYHDKNSKCLIVQRMNPGRYDFKREFGRGLKGGNVLHITLHSKASLFKEFDRRYYGTSN